MKKNNSWIVWVIALVAIIALVIAIVALAKINMTGQGIFEWFKKESTTNQLTATSESRGLLGDAFVSIGGDKNSLKGYEVKYDENGDLIYEIVDDGIRFNIGEGYELRDTESGGMIVYSINNGDAASGGFSCGCNFPPGSTGTCTNKCTKYGDGCTGSCTGDTCQATGCKVKAERIESTN